MPHRKEIIVDPNYFPEEGDIVKIIKFITVLLGIAAGVFVWTIGL